MSGGIDPGCIRIRLGIDGGRVNAVELVNDRPQVARVLCGRPADEAVRLVPLLFSICGKAQGRAASLAFAAARGEPSAPRLEPEIAAEAMREHLWRWLLDLPLLVGEPPLRAEFAAAVAWIARGQRERLAGLLEDPRVARLSERLQEAVVIREEAAALLPPLHAADSLQAWTRLGTEFCRQPAWRDLPAETGALGRRGGGTGNALWIRWQARLDELRAWTLGADDVCAAGASSSAQVAPGVGRALVETARGLLMHEITLDGDHVADYSIVAPTEWNFHPDGSLPRWLRGRVLADRATFALEMALVVATLDPCVRWELEWL